MANTAKNRYLALDVGGTKTAVACYDSADDSYTPLHSESYRSSDYSGVEEILRDYLARFDQRPAWISLGVAGVVDGSTAQVTNLPWKISRDALLELGFQDVSLVNDMTAVAASIPLLSAADLFCLQEGDEPSGMVAAILAPGTGLGQGYLLTSPNKSYPQGSEGGHCDFAPVTSLQVELLNWLRGSRDEPVSYEQVCAGPAIATLYDFFVWRGCDKSADVARVLEQETDRTPVIAEAAVSGSCPCCCEALNLFLMVLGQEAANLFLKVYATRGLYLAGGILPRLKGRLSFAPFIQGLRRQHSMQRLLERVRVNLITRNDAPLLGAASYARELALRDKEGRVPQTGRT